MIENKLGNGMAALVTSMNYPGHSALRPLYRDLLREFVTMSARDCDTQVLGRDRVRYAVYEGSKLYLLNTDYDLPTAVKVVYKDTEQWVTLESLELKSIELT